MTYVLLIQPSEWEYVNTSTVRQTVQNIRMSDDWMFHCIFFSGAVLAGQEAGPEVEQSSCSHPEHMEEVEGEICKE